MIATQARMPESVMQRLRRSLLFRGGAVVLILGLLALIPVRFIDMTAQEDRVFASEDGLIYLGESQAQWWLHRAYALLGVGLVLTLIGVLCAIIIRYPLARELEASTWSTRVRNSIPSPVMQVIRRFARLCVYGGAVIAAVAARAGLNGLLAYRQSHGQLISAPEEELSLFALFWVGAVFVSLALGFSRIDRPLGAVRTAALYSGVGIAVFGLATPTGYPQSMEWMIFEIASGLQDMSTTYGQPVQLLLQIVTPALLLATFMAYRLEMRDGVGPSARWSRLLVRVFGWTWCALLISPVVLIAILS